MSNDSNAVIKLDMSIYGNESFLEPDLLLIQTMGAILANRKDAECYQADPNIALLMSRAVANLKGVEEMMRMVIIGQVLGNNVDG
jgi:hypothetical protein